MCFQLRMLALIFLVISITYGDSPSFGGTCSRTEKSSAKGMCARRLPARDRKLRHLRKTPLRRKRSNRRNNPNNRQVASRGCRVVIGSPADRFRESCIVVRLHGHRIVSASADVVRLSAFAASYSCPRPRHRIVVRIRGRGEMVDARDLKSLGGNPVRVRVPPSAPAAAESPTAQ
jgi:hypothetical protein